MVAEVAQTTDAVPLMASSACERRNQRCVKPADKASKPPARKA